MNGLLAAYIPRGGRQVMTYIPEDEPQRSGIARPLALRLVAIARGEENREGLLIEEINGIPGRRPSAGSIPHGGWLLRLGDGTLARRHQGSRSA